VEFLVEKDALQKFREPAGWALVGAAALQLLAGLIGLFAGSGGFTLNALLETASAGLLTGAVLAGLVVLAVVLVTRGESPAPQARVIAMIGLGVLGGALLFGVIALLSGMLASTGSGDGASKAAAFLFGVSKLAVTGIAGFYVFSVFQSLQPAAPAVQAGGLAPGYQAYGQQYGYPQPGQPYDPQQVGQPPVQQALPQGYDPQAQQPAYDPQQYGQQYQPGYAPQQPYGQQPGYGQAYPQQQPQQPEADAGGWTQAYGGGEAQQQHGQQPSQPEGNDRNWYGGEHGPQ
jgi:hypothetical protein